MAVVGAPKRDDFKRVVLEAPVINGRVPPHDLDAEAGILSAIMLGAAAMPLLAECSDLRPDHFYSEAHARIWAAVLEVAAEGKPVDVLTVSSKLKDQQRLAQVGGTPYLGQILDAAPVVENVGAYVVQVIDLWRARQTILACQQVAAQGYGERTTSEALRSELDARLSKIGNAQRRETRAELGPLLHKVYNRMAGAFSDGRPPGIATGLGSLDDIIAGLHRTDLTIVAGRPGMGKTALMIAIALNVAGCSPMLLSDDGTPWQPQGVAFFSCEMPREQIGMRAIAIDSMVSAQRMRTGRLDAADWQPMTWTCERLSKLPFVVDDQSSLPIETLRAKVRREKAVMAARGVRLAAVFADYLQLMKGSGAARTRVEEIGEISRGCKAIAKDEDVALVVGCQLNRAVETRTGSEKRPRLTDLRESGDIEQDADNVIFIHRPNYYGEKDPEGEEGRTELLVPKQRNGPTGTAIVQYVASCTRFQPMPGY